MSFSSSARAASCSVSRCFCSTSPAGVRLNALPTDWRASRAFSAPSQLRRCRERSEEHTSELQSQSNLVCRLLLEKKKNRKRPDSSAPAIQHVPPVFFLP